MSLSLSLSHSIRQRISHEQRLEHTLAVRLELINALQGEEYRSDAQCPACHRRMNSVEVLKGFTQDPTDFTTQCTNCKTRFPPKLSMRGRSNVEVAFYCDVQTLAQLPGHERLTPDELRKQVPAIYHSAIFHNGSLRAAFARINIQYEHTEVVDPMTKVKPFLGRMPDTEIARITGLKLRDIRYERRNDGISAYRLN